MNRTRSIALIVVFAALTAILDALPGLPQLSSGVWYGWTFIATPLAGIVLGPWEAFLSVLIGVMISHAIVFKDVYEIFFTLGAPVGAMVSSLVFRGKPRPVLPYYVALLGAYFLTPTAWSLPLWALWDTYVAFVVLVVVILFKRRLYGVGGGRLTYAFSALVGLEADILFRIFLFVPLGTWSWLYQFPLEFVQMVWVVSAAVTPIQVGIALFMTSLCGGLLLKASST